MMKMFMESNERAEARRREEKIAEEERIEARRVAAEERAEERAEAKRVRKVEEARRAEEREAAREEAARLASERLREQQEAANARAYEQQVALIKMQAEIDERAAEAHRMEQGANRKRERAVFGISNYRENEDVEDFLSTSERKLKAGGVLEGEWLSIIASKMSGKIGSTWHDLCVAMDDYYEVKAGLLRVCGYTPKLAGELFYGFRAESLKGMSGDQLYHRGVQLIRRMVAPQKLTPELEFALLKPWVWSIVSKKARLVLDSRTVGTSAELIEALQDHLVMEGERTEGQAAVFKGQSPSEGGRERMAPLTCFTCGKQGHKAVDCWSDNNSSPYQPVSVSGSAAATITCFACGELGHKSTQCPNKDRNGKGESNLLRQVKAEPKEVQVKPVRRIRKQQNKDTVLRMKVNSQSVPVLLDSGSSVTVVPENMVAETQKTGDIVAIKGFGAKKYIELPMAEIPFEVGKLSWVETVALAPKGEEFEEEGVVFGLDLRSERGFSLVRLANEGNPVNKCSLDRWAKMEKGESEAEAVVEESSSVETLVEEEEESGDEILESEWDFVEEDDKPKRLRRLVVLSKEEIEKEDGREVGGEVGGVIEQLEPDASVVKREGSELEACTQVSYDFCFNVMPPPKPRSQTEKKMEQMQQMDQLDPQSRSTGSILVGGDVGTAHRRRKKEKERDDAREEDSRKNIEQDQRPFM